MPAYKYQAVTAGAIWQKKPTTLPRAKERVASLRAGTHAGFHRPDAEVERVAFIGLHGRRYWRWRGGKWATDFWRDPSPDDLAKWN